LLLTESLCPRVADKGRAFLQREILSCRTPFAALVREGD
jgi:hypothetical protein